MNELDPDIYTDYPSMFIFPLHFLEKNEVTHISKYKTEFIVTNFFRQIIHKQNVVPESSVDLSPFLCKTSRAPSGSHSPLRRIPDSCSHTVSPLEGIHSNGFPSANQVGKFNPICDTRF